MHVCVSTCVIVSTGAFLLLHLNVARDWLVQRLLLDEGIQHAMTRGNEFHLLDSAP